MSDLKRFKIKFESPESLLGELTRSICRGSVSLGTQKAVPAGTRFIFELYAEGVPDPVEVECEVLSVSPPTGANGRRFLHVCYSAPKALDAVDRVVWQLFKAHQYEKMRKHPRVPVHILATEDEPYSPSYIIRSLSLGGMGVEVAATEVPARIKVGAPVETEVSVSAGVLALKGEVVWLVNSPAGQPAVLSPSFGVRFSGDIKSDALEGIDELLSLKRINRSQSRARLHFGAAPSERSGGE